MSDESLSELLAQLHSRLSRAKKLDPESRELLLTVSDDIRKALADKSAGQKGSRKESRKDSRDTSHESRLEELAVRFEADHPTLAEALREISDTLAKAGI
jgi:uncharacterized protein DUF4404